MHTQICSKCIHNHIRYLARSGTWHDLVPGTIWYLARSGIWYPARSGTWHDLVSGTWYIYIYPYIFGDCQKGGYSQRGVGVEPKTFLGKSQRTDHATDPVLLDVVKACIDQFVYVKPPTLIIRPGGPQREGLHVNATPNPLHDCTIGGRVKNKSTIAPPVLHLSSLTPPSRCGNAIQAHVQAQSRDHETKRRVTKLRREISSK
jgi:hypothetical protein